MTTQKPEDAVLLSIDPEHADSILKGLKEYEYRKVAPLLEPPFKVFLYATSPKKMVVGEARCVGKISGDTTKIIEQTVDRVNHSRKDIAEYFAGSDVGFAMELTDTRMYDVRPTLDYLRERDMEPSENFRYVNPDKIEETLL